MTISEIKRREAELREEQDSMAGLVVAIICSFGTLGFGLLAWSVLL